MSVEDVLSTIAEKEVKFVDLRFTDTRGKEQHVTLPGQRVDERVLRRRQDVRRVEHRRLEGDQRVGHGPDARGRHRGHGPVLRRDHADLALRHLEPTTMEGYERDPRSWPSAPRRI